MIPLAIILVILNIIVVKKWPDPAMDWVNYTVIGMLIAAIIMWAMKGIL